MRFSCFLAPTGRGPVDDLQLLDFCMEFALACDEAGFAIVSVGDQHFNNYEPYGNPFTMIAALAGHMKRSYLGITVVPLVFYHPWRFAQFSNLVDLMTRGRCLIGLSSGSMSGLLKAFGISTDIDPKAVFDLKLDAALKGFAKQIGDPPFTFDSGIDSGTLPTRIMPISYRTPHPLFAIGSNTDKTIAATGLRGWPAYLGRYRTDVAIRKMSVYRTAVAQGNHPASVVNRCLTFSSITKGILVARTEEEAWELAEGNLRDYMNFYMTMSQRTGTDMGPVAAESRSMRELWNDRSNLSEEVTWPTHAQWLQNEAIVGGVDSVVEQLEHFRDNGCDHLNLRFFYGTFNPEEAWRNFTLFTQEVMPRLDPQALPEVTLDEIRNEHRSATLAPTPRLNKVFASRSR
jgi:alkanesulfonate monooxygenase SsuD/methylene tetrahydromethanopterin reductase-like flavin-dependent oxidoreductase (luciferase family)